MDRTTCDVQAGWQKASKTHRARARLGAGNTKAGSGSWSERVCGTRTMAKKLDMRSTVTQPRPRGEKGLKNKSRKKLSKSLLAEAQRQ